MRKRLLVVAVVFVLFGAGGGIAAAAPSAQAGHRTGTSSGFAKGKTEVTLDPGAAAALTSLGVRVVPLFAGVRSAGGKTYFGFPIVGNPADGTIEHLGGLLLYRGHSWVTLTRYTIDLNRGVLSGQVNFGARADLFTLGAATPDGVTLALTGGAAAALNATFGVSAFTEGLVLGYGTPRLRK